MINIKSNKDGSHYIEGDFEFNTGKLIYNPNELMPTIKINFEWTPEIPQHFEDLDIEYFYNLVGDKIKKDFIKFLKSK